jgi:EAL domain-containing protein (putative c-di-GMP-specific phosphodiesterase class I)
MQAELEARIALEKDLRNALAENQFKLYYQMQVNHAGHILGAEVLIRWEHPQRGLISPMQFIPLAEETGLIMHIGQWVLDTACAQIKSWEADPHTRDLQLAVIAKVGNLIWNSQIPRSLLFTNTPRLWQLRWDIVMY